MLIVSIEKAGSKKLSSDWLEDMLRLAGAKPKVVELEEPESGLLGAWRAMREFLLPKQGMARMARLGEAERGDDGVDVNCSSQIAAGSGITTTSTYPCHEGEDVFEAEPVV